MKRKKSFRTKIIVAFIASILTAIIAMDAVGVYMLYEVTIKDAKDVVQSIGEGNVEHINGILRDVSHSVEVLYVDALHTIGSNPERLEDEEFRQEFREDISDMMYDVVRTTDGAVGVYLLYDQYDSYSNDYIYYKKVGNDYEPDTSMHPISDYSTSDYEHVGWYYDTIAAGEATWISPYFKESVNETVFSYTIPIYVNHIFVGIVGMDISISFLQDIVSQISAYDTGYGFLLTSHNDVIYHPDYNMGDKFADLSASTREQITSLNSNKYVMNTDILEASGKRKWVTYRTLENGMILGLSVFEEEIVAPVMVLFQRTIMITILVLLITAIIVIQTTFVIVRPLNELAQVAVRLGKGDMDVEIPRYGTDEFGKLSDAFRTMRNKIKESFDYMSGLAYTDLMTGTNNKGAFERDSMGLTSNCQKNREIFAVIAIDANDLKSINDRYGHAEGDELIKAIGFCLMGVFGKRNTYRVGGDEFSVLLRENNSLRIEEDIRSFRLALKLYFTDHPGLLHEPVSVAVGYALFDPDANEDFATVYQSADASMYENKKEMKAQKKSNNDESNRE